MASKSIVVFISVLCLLAAGTGWFVLSKAAVPQAGIVKISDGANASDNPYKLCRVAGNHADIFGKCFVVKNGSCADPYVSAGDYPTKDDACKSVQSGGENEAWCTSKPTDC